MTPKKLSVLSILIGLSILGQSSVLYASQAQYDDADIDKIIQSLQKKEVNSDYKLFSRDQPEIKFGNNTQEGYKNATALYHDGKVTIKSQNNW